MAIGLVLIRVVVGCLFIGHGTQKLFGWFGGGGPDRTGQMFDSVGYRPARIGAIGAGLAETSGGALLAVGFLTPLGSVAIMVVMIGAIVAVHLPNGMWNTAGGSEYPLTMATVALGLAFTGPGRFSLDRALDWHLRGVAWGLWVLLAALVIGTVVSAVGAANRRSDRAQERHDRPSSVHRAA
jgi:putative oxidoreductase